MGELFGTDGIRGQANSYPVTPEIALRTGKALAQVLSQSGRTHPRVVIGKDTRLSGYMLETALTSGLVSMGTEVLLVGPVPTPAVAHLTRSMAAGAGIALTASHNPYDDNGIKIFGADGFKLPDREEEEIEQLVVHGDVNCEHIRSDRLGKAYRIEDARGRYVEFAKSSIGNRNLEGLKIALDCANGAAYFLGPLIFHELGAEVVELCTAPDGMNINNQCGALHPENTAQAVVNSGAHAGISLDGDADRVIFCDAKGNVVDGDCVLALCALEMQRRSLLTQNTLVTTVMSNLGLYDSMNRHGINVVTTGVGDRKVIECMRKGGYNLGGENSGHVIFMDYARTGDGIITALQVLRMMQDNDIPLDQLASCMQHYPQESTSISVTEKKPLEELGTLQAALQECNHELGEHGRTLIRYSGTENKLRILVESRNHELTKKWCSQLASAAEQDVGKEAQ